MMARKSTPPPSQVEPKIFASVDEIDRGVRKLKRRVADLEELDIPSAVLQDTGTDDVVESDIREAIREVFGANSPEFGQHEYVTIWAGGTYTNMTDADIVDAKERGRVWLIGILNGLIARLEEKREDLQSDAESRPTDILPELNLHPRISEVATALFVDGYPWDAVFAAAKSLVNYVKERSGQHDLDGAPLMRRVFSRKDPILAFNGLADQTDGDEQEGMMHLFEGVVLGIRNPGGHAFPEGSEQRAMEYISLISLLAYRVQETSRIRTQG